MLEVTPLESLVPVAITGKDARNFMQAQITGDIKKLTPEQAIWGAKCTPQGRVQMLVTLIDRPDDTLLALFQAAQSEETLARLNKTKLASKIAFESSSLVLAPISAADAQTLVETLPTAPGASKTVGEITVLRWWGPTERYLLIAPPSAVSVRPTSSEEALAWRRSDVVAGIPQVYPETNNSFVPQNLNLDLLSGVAYDKGCYIGQEVVARAKRNGVPRRMLAFSAPCAAPPPGTIVLAGETEAGEVVDAVPSQSGCTLLAVVETENATAALALRGISDSNLIPTVLPYEVPLTKPDKGPSRLPPKAPLKPPAKPN